MSRSRLTRLSVFALVVVIACSSPSSEVTPPPPATPPPPPPAGATVAAITVTPANTTLSLAGTSVLTAVATDAAGLTVVTTFTWQSSRETVATVDASGKVTAVAAGSAIITASSGTVKSGGVTVVVTDDASWPTGGTRSSGELIQTALNSGALTSEQALTYQVYSEFRDSRLPVPYRGAPDRKGDNAILRTAAARYATLSPATQALIAPFFVSPGSEGSWFQARFGGGVSGGSSRAVRTAGQTGSDDCQTVLAAFFTTATTTHFSVHYSSGTWLSPQAAAYAAQTAAVVLAEAEKIFTAVTGAFGRMPLTDAGFSGNGCDDKVDIWIYDIIGWSILNDKDVAGKVVPYLSAACKKPSSIHLEGNPDSKKVRNALAHEFWHVLEVGSYNRSSCSPETAWLGEATGNWAMDLVYPLDQAEQGWAPNYSLIERLVPLDDAGTFGDANRTNGYCDYVFLLYLARKFDNSVIKAIWDATESSNSLPAIANALTSRGGIKKIWPDFALAMWNDPVARNQDDLNKWDPPLDWGLKKAFDAADAGTVSGAPSTKVVMQSASRKTFDLMSTATSLGSGRQLNRLSIHADYLKFTDINAASVLYLNPMSLFDFPNLKIQVMIKQGGTWKPAEDWTKLSFKSYCRDLAAERVEEMVLIYTNSDGTDSPAPVIFLQVPTVTVSNVGCAKWTGTASVETLYEGFPRGSSIASVANLTMERLRYPELPDGAPGQESFTNTSGVVSGSSSGLCITSSTQGSVSARDADLLIGLDNVVGGLSSGAPAREILQGIGSSGLSTTNTFTCNGTVSVGNQFWSWMEIPVPGYSVSADGRTMTGNVVETAPVGVPPFTKTVKWNLTAVREP